MHRRLARLALALLVIGGSIAPAINAEAVGQGTAACTGTMTLTFGSPVTEIPSLSGKGFGIHGDATCPAGRQTSISWDGAGVAVQGTNCDVFLTANVAATGTFNVAGYNPPVLYEGAGPTSVQTWVMVDMTGLQLIAVGEFAWLNTAEQLACSRGLGTNTMTLTGALVVVT
jgi:hypothetical protein